jgi:hypothetical protein
MLLPIPGVELGSGNPFVKIPTVAPAEFPARRGASDSASAVRKVVGVPEINVVMSRGTEVADRLVETVARTGAKEAEVGDGKLPEKEREELDGIVLAGCDVEGKVDAECGAESLAVGEDVKPAEETATEVEETWETETGVVAGLLMLAASEDIVACTALVLSEVGRSEVLGGTTGADNGKSFSWSVTPT